MFIAIRQQPTATYRFQCVCKTSLCRCTLFFEFLMTKWKLVAHCLIDNYDSIESFITFSEPLNGHWNAWGSWSSCTKQCDKGTKTRSRICNNPVPTNGGLPCPGSSSETVDCRIKKCHQRKKIFEEAYLYYKHNGG